jgi:hypothetical protein
MKTMKALLAGVLLAAGTVVLAPVSHADTSCSTGGQGASYVVVCSRGPGSQYQARATCHYNLFPWDDQVKIGGWSGYGTKTYSIVQCGWNHSWKGGGVNFR